MISVDRRLSPLLLKENDLRLDLIQVPFNPIQLSQGEICFLLSAPPLFLKLDDYFLHLLSIDFIFEAFFWQVAV